LGQEQLAQRSPGLLAGGNHAARGGGLGSAVSTPSGVLAEALDTKSFWCFLKIVIKQV